MAGEEELDEWEIAISLGDRLKSYGKKFCELSTFYTSNGGLLSLMSYPKP